ncbi:hypothetical protein ACHAWF_004387, partial [Thalassiosira exigua]
GGGEVRGGRTVTVSPAPPARASILSSFTFDLGFARRRRGGERSRGGAPPSDLRADPRGPKTARRAPTAARRVPRRRCGRCRSPPLPPRRPHPTTPRSEPMVDAAPSSLDRLRRRYDRSAALSDEVRLFWTLSPPPSGRSDRSDEPSDDDDDVASEPEEVDATIDFAVAYRLPRSSPPDERPPGRGGGDVAREDEPRRSRWLGFGISPQGGMIGADMMIYLPPQRRANRSERLLDVHGREYSFPAMDRCGQDWELVGRSTIPPALPSSVPSGMPSGAWEEGGSSWHVVEARRALEANDVNEDLAFVDDSSRLVNPTRVLAAWGEFNSGDESDGRRRTRMPNNLEAADDEYVDLTSMLDPHGPSGRVSAAVRFFAPDPLAGQSGSTEKLPYIDLMPPEPFRVPGRETTYRNFCYQIEDYPELASVLADRDQVHIVAFEDVVGGPLVHHMDLHGTDDELLGRDKRLCRVYTDLIHPWEAGSPRTFELPEEAGIPLGRGGYRSFRVEVHYHNPTRSSGILDRSGVRLYYSLEKRPHVAGLMLLGDYMLKLRGSYTVGNAGGGTKHSFYCPPSCFSERRLGGGGGDDDDEAPGDVTVFREVLHMHRSGARMTNVRLDSGGNVVHASEANRFDFSRGAGYASRRVPYRVSEGDSFVTTCYFATRGVVWGSSSDEEMCQSFLWYYPKRVNSLTCGYVDPVERRSNDSLESIGCEMSYDRVEVAAGSDLERLRPDEVCQAAEASGRPATSFETRYADLKTWPSLLQLVNKWKQGGIKAVTGLYNSTSSATASSPSQSIVPRDENCHLCPNGRRPSRPDAVIEGFDWTCDELDAALPVLYTRPELLYFSASDVAPCESYRSSFGALCCLVAEDASSPWLTPMRTRDFVLCLTGALLLSLGMVRMARQQLCTRRTYQTRQ